MNEMNEMNEMDEMNEMNEMNEVNGKMDTDWIWLISARNEEMSSWRRLKR